VLTILLLLEVVEVVLVMELAVVEAELVVLEQVLHSLYRMVKDLQLLLAQVGQEALALIQQVLQVEIQFFLLLLLMAAVVEQLLVQMDQMEALEVAVVVEQQLRAG
jgi:hypothetical protein